MNAWSWEPNAKHIDWVVESVRRHPELWRAAWSETWSMAACTAWVAGYNAALSAAHMTRPTILDAIFVSARNAVRGDAEDAVWHAAVDAILSLIAYDDCDQYLSMSSEELRAWALLTEHPAAILLLPMVIVREQIEQAAT